MLVNNDKTWYRAAFKNEAEIEQVVRQYRHALFGPNIIFLEKAKITTLGGSSTVPDGFVIDIEGDKWYLLEAELASHGTWQHIAPQISRQLVAAQAPLARAQLLNLALMMIDSDADAKGMFEALNVSPLGIHSKVETILRETPIVALPIDNMPPDLKEWISTLRASVAIWIIEKYESSDGTEIVYSLPDDNLPTYTTRTRSNTTEVEVVARPSQPFQMLLKAGLLSEGQQLFLAYAPRQGTLPNRGRRIRSTGRKFVRRFTATVRTDGIELDGRVMSLSAAAVQCIQKAGGFSENANGWKMWRTEAGLTLSDLSRKAGSDGEIPVNSADQYKERQKSLFVT